MDPVVITGCGWVTPFAAGTLEDVLRAAAHRPSALTLSDGYWAVSDELLGAFPILSPECRGDRGARLTAVAFEFARREASLPGSIAPERIGLVLGHALAGQSGMIEFANDVRQQSPRFVSPIRFPQTVGNYISGALSRAYDLRGPNSTIANGPSSGLDAIVEGCALLTARKADVVFAGGTERLTAALAMGLSDPGLIFSDGACLFVLERPEDATARGAKILAMIVSRDIPEPRASARAIPTSPHSIQSVAGTIEVGAIYIEHWIGCCLGALSAAAVAAAVGAARGLAVPVIDVSDGPVVSVREWDACRSSEPKMAVVTARGNDGRTASLAIALADNAATCVGTPAPHRDR